MLKHDAALNCVLVIISVTEDVSPPPKMFSAEGLLLVFMSAVQLAVYGGLRDFF